MQYYVSYYLTNDAGTLAFDSEKEACEFLGVSKCTVASCA